MNLVKTKNYKSEVMESTYDRFYADDSYYYFQRNVLC